ncbi:hypothetical protein ALO83_104122 [Pseudomonas cannabina pv. alisalensis]|uniref:Uncharacterized protein n=1 Tax=Pseudomonas cannabina TaxID=86840 RepID=A0A3M3RA17_PSECA|nr:hypothetical protein ALO83_104122 [Pseudomonas cannabina pv. alisalensis]RMN78721.1 hypothetical protein ALQ52_104872 [Pseudomonas cannabina pv. alisalensis]RMN80924.1 hypothetical protein ALQ53_103846 [Pseudomonas cannabina]RMN93329.1 hypothetical protein ALQ51_102423 [Pseudomonas cannabina]
MFLDTRLGRRIARGRCCFGIFQFRKKTVDQGLLFAVHDHLTELPLDFFPAAMTGPCSGNGASSTRFNDMKKKITSRAAARPLRLVRPGSWAKVATCF